MTVGDTNAVAAVLLAHRRIEALCDALLAATTPLELSQTLSGLLCDILQTPPDRSILQHMYVPLTRMRTLLTRHVVTTYRDEVDDLFEELLGHL